MSRPTAISLFTGAGGLDLGLEAAGFRTAVALERDDDAVATLRHNRRWPVIAEDLHDVSPEKILEVAGLRKRQPDLLSAGPPCQPFSKSGYWHRGDSLRLADPRAATLDAFLAVLEASQPRVFLLENVPGLAFNQKAEGLLFLKERIKSLNRRAKTSYRPVAMKLNAVEYGIPQLRERVFVVGHRDGLEIEPPQTTHVKPPPVNMATGAVDCSLSHNLGDKLPALTAWDAIGHLDQSEESDLIVRGKWARLLPTIPEGHNYLFHTSRGGGEPLFGWRTRFWSMLLKLAKNRPSWTLTAQPGPATGPFHWKNRRLSADELCALQTFPASYRVLGSQPSVHRQIGNAVPSALAEVLGHEIRNQWRTCHAGGAAVGARPCGSRRFSFKYVTSPFLFRVGKAQPSSKSIWFSARRRFRFRAIDCPRLEVDVFPFHHRRIGGPQASEENEVLSSWRKNRARLPRAQPRSAEIRGKIPLLAGVFQPWTRERCCAASRGNRERFGPTVASLRPDKNPFSASL